MTYITKVVCDSCGEEVVDVHNEDGWIRIEGSTTGSTFTITRYKGRQKNGNAKTEFLPGLHQLDFCTEGCLNDYLSKRGIT